VLHFIKAACYLLAVTADERYGGAVVKKPERILNLPVVQVKFLRNDLYVFRRILFCY